MTAPKLSVMVHNAWFRVRWRINLSGRPPLFDFTAAALLSAGVLFFAIAVIAWRSWEQNWIAVSAGVAGLIAFGATGACVVSAWRTRRSGILWGR